MGFLPSVEKRPVRPSSGGGNYFRPNNGKNKVRILSDAVLGYLYWNTQGKPVRSVDHPGNPTDIRISDKTGSPESIKFFWAMVVWDYEKEQLGIWEVTQGTIQDQIEAIADNEDWGHPRDYDLTITRTGEGLGTKYNVQPSPKKAVSKEIVDAYKEAAINLKALFVGGNPFEGGGSTDMGASAGGHPDWDTYLKMLDEAETADDVEEAKQWAANSRRIAKLATVFGSDAAVHEQIQKTASAIASHLLTDNIPF